VRIVACTALAVVFLIAVVLKGKSSKDLQAFRSSLSSWGLRRATVQTSAAALVLAAEYGVSLVAIVFHARAAGLVPALVLLVVLTLGLTAQAAAGQKHCLCFGQVSSLGSVRVHIGVNVGLIALGGVGFGHVWVGRTVGDVVVQVFLGLLIAFGVVAGEPLARLLVGSDNPERSPTVGSSRGSRPGIGVG
jgi:hypothetical protein